MTRTCKTHNTYVWKAYSILLLQSEKQRLLINIRSRWKDTTKVDDKK